MLKISHFVMILLFFVLMLLLFLVFNPDSYPVRVTADTETILLKNTSDLNINNTDSDLMQNSSQNNIIIISHENDTETDNILKTLGLLKQGYNIIPSVSDIIIQPEIIIITGTYSANINEIELQQLKHFLSSGSSVILTSLPDTISDEFSELLGIVSYGKSRKFNSFTIYDGLLIGGMFHAEDIFTENISMENFSCENVPVTLSSYCKVFGDSYYETVKLYETPKEEREAVKNPIIWRTYYESGKIFVINAPFMEELTGAGILTGLFSFVYEDFIYPVIGTKTVVLDNFPFIADENLVINNRTADVYNRDIIWPDLLSVARNLNITYTCYTNGDFFNNSKSYSILEFFSNELYKATRGELGYSLSPQSNINNDMLFLKNQFPYDVIKSVKYSESFPDDNLSEYFYDTTSFLSKTMDFTWLNDGVVSLPLINTGSGDNEYANFKSASFLSAFGYMMHSIDIAPMFTGEEVWNISFIETSSFLSQTFSNKNYLNAASVRNTAETVKNYLNTDISVSQTAESIHVSTDNSQRETMFILRTSKNIDKHEGCSIEKIENGIYMVKSSVSDFTIEFAVNNV